MGGDKVHPFLQHRAHPFRHRLYFTQSIRTIIFETGLTDCPNLIDHYNWQWSSYLATIDRTMSPQSLQTHWLLRQFGSDRTQATLHYIDFVRAGVGLAPIWEDLRHQIYLGGDDFVRNLQTQISSTVADNREIPKSQRRSIAFDSWGYLRV